MMKINKIKVIKLNWQVKIVKIDKIKSVKIN